MMKKVAGGQTSLPGMGGMNSPRKAKKNKKKNKNKSGRSGNPMKREAEEQALRQKLGGRRSSGSAFMKNPQRSANQGVGGHLPQGLPTNLPNNLDSLKDLDLGSLGNLNLPGGNA